MTSVVANGNGTVSENGCASEEEEEEEDAHGFRVIQPCFQRQSSALHQSPAPSSVSSTLDDLFTCDAVLITDGGVDSHNTGAVLRYCRRRILRPRDIILSLLGYRDWAKDGTGWCACTKFLNVTYFAFMVLFLCLGPILQYNMCFKRDQGIGDEVFVSLNKSNFKKHLPTDKCIGNYLFVYVIPSAMFLLAYLMTCFVLRCGDSENLQTLLERVYLIATCSPWEVVKHRRLGFMWITWILIGVVNLALSASSMVLHLISAKDIPCAINILCSTTILKNIFSSIAVASLWLGDASLIVGILLYCSQCHLLEMLLNIIHATLQQGAASLLAIKKQIDESMKFVQHLNRELGLIVGLILCVTLFRSVTGIVALITTVKSYNLSVFSPPTSMTRTEDIPWIHLTAMTINVMCWLFMSILPLVMAARVSNGFRVLSKVGSTLHARPFGYQLTPQQDIDSFLLYVSSLRLKAKIMWIPIRTYFLVSFMMLLIMSTVVLGYVYL